MKKGVIYILTNPSFLTISKLDMHMILKSG